MSKDFLIMAVNVKENCKRCKSVCTLKHLINVEGISESCLVYNILKCNNMLNETQIKMPETENARWNSKNNF